MERFVITGASGLVGRELVDVLSAIGHPVCAWQRSPAPAAPPAGVEYRRFELGTTPGAEIERALRGVDVLVHCAWDLHAATWPDIERVNVQGSVAWLEAAARAGVRKLIFVSSISAYDGCQSMYGRSKLAVERAVERLGGVSVRPGLVHGDPTAGVYGRLWQSTGAPFIPLIDGGRQRMLTVHRHDLARAIERMAADYPRWSGRIAALGHPDLVTMRELLDDIARSRGLRARFVPVPGGAVMLALRTAESLGLRLRFRSDSLVTLRGPAPVVDRKVLDEVGVAMRPHRAALAAAGGAPAGSPPARGECDAISRHLIGRPCPPAVAERYARGVRDLDLSLSPSEALAWSVGCRFPPALACLDAGVAIWDREGAVRRRLLLMFALLESTPEHADRFLFRPRGVGMHARTLARCAVAPLAMLVGTPFGLACRTGSRRKR